MGNSDFKILIIDSNSDVTTSLKNLLESEGYTVISSLRSAKGLQIALKEKPQLVILEMLLPELDGVEICTELRKRSQLNEMLIVFYTSRNDDYSQIAAFNAGADDYIIKPVKQKILISRIKALLKRHPANQRKVITTNNTSFVIDRERYVVIVDGNEIILPRKEFELIALLSASPRKVFTRKEISQLIWGYDFVEKNRTIDVHILKIREKLGDNYIKTIKGVGYRFGE